MNVQQIYEQWEVYKKCCLKPDKAFLAWLQDIGCIIGDEKDKKKPIYRIVPDESGYKKELLFYWNTERKDIDS